MTLGEMYDEIEKKLEAGINDIVDWRPASDMYIEDIVEVFDDGGACVPNGIRIWLDNGDSIIYVKKEVKK